MVEIKKELSFRIMNSNYIDQMDKLIQDHLKDGWRYYSKEMEHVIEKEPQMVDAYWRLKLTFVKPYGEKSA